MIMYCVYVEKYWRPTEDKRRQKLNAGWRRDAECMCGILLFVLCTLTRYLCIYVYILLEIVAVADYICIKINTLGFFLSTIWYVD